MSLSLQEIKRIAQEDGDECAIETIFEEHLDWTRDQAVDLLEEALSLSEVKEVGDARK
jgi:hypothetical protein